MESNNTAGRDLYRISFKDGVGVEHILNGLYTIDMASEEIEKLKKQFPGYNDFNLKKHEI